MSSVKWNLQNIATNEVIEITKSLFKVGRHYEADIRSKSSVLSRNHAVLLILIDGLYVQDNKSCNGTFINDKIIAEHEQRKLNPGDEVGFGWCTSKENANPCQEDPKPCIFRVLRVEPKEDTEPSTSTTENIAEVEDDECIIISDDENDNPFACSQILEISAKIKKEPSFLNNSIDPYYEIKQELRELDYCENIAYDLTEAEQDKILNDTDLLRVLESQDTSGEAEKQSLKDTKENESIASVDISGIHKDSKAEDAKDAETTSGSNKAKIEKKKLTRHTGGNLRKTENSLKNISNKSQTKKKHTKAEEHDKKSEECNKHFTVDNNKKSQEVNKKTFEEQNDKILEQKKLTVVLNKMVGTKSKYVKPPIVKPHIQERRSSTNLAVTTKIERKRKNSLSLDANKKMKTDNDTGAFKNREINKNLKNNIIKERKRKLQELTDQNKPKSRNKLTYTSPKIKVSESRGNFLLNKAPIPAVLTSKVTDTVNLPAKIIDPRTFFKEPSTKSVSEPQILQPAKSTSEQHMEQSAKLGNQIQDMTVTSNLSPSDTTASMPKEKVKKLETFLHQGPDSTVDDRPGSSFGNTIQNFLASRSYNGGKHRYDRYYAFDNIDAEIAKIMQWPVRWLQEQQNFDISPPVYGDLPPQFISSNFTNFNDYVRTMTPVVLLELWQYSFQALYENNDHNPPKNVFLLHWRGTQSATYIDCEIQIPESELKHNIPFRVDDLIIVELILAEKQLYKYMAFGYIKSCNRTQTMNKDQHLANLKFMIVTKPVPKPIFGKKLIVKVIANIGGFLRLLKVMKYLEVSPLLQRILHPVVIDYSFTVEPNVKNIISGMQLNKEQMQITEEATNMCIENSPGLYLIKGPPGTGKSTVIVNIVLEILFRSKQKGIEPLILLTAPSNTAVDNLVLKLSTCRQKLTEYHKKLLKLVRVGPETSISKNVEKYKLGSLARNNIVSSNNFNHLKEYKDFLNTGKDVDDFLRKHLKNRYYYEIQQAEHNLLRCSSVICTTLNSSVSHRILQLTRRNELRFTCAIIDEATQCNELESLLPLQLQIDKFVLVGDPQQLPAVVCNKEAQKLGFEKSLFSRITENFNNKSVPRIKMLYEQYRMRPEICDYPNKTFYDGKLRNSPIILNKLEPSVTPYLLFNLTSMKTDESDYINTDEVHVICKLLETLRTNIKKSCKYTIGIITPYRAQKELLRKSINRIRFGPDVYIAVNTVDSFQGLENDIIIISCVRYSSNNFLQNQQRLNVALTRAKQALYIVGNYTLFKECRTFYDLREDAKQRKLCLDIGGDVKDLPTFNKHIIR